MVTAAGNESMIAGSIKMLYSTGLLDFFLPFLLFFAIVYGALDKTDIFGEDSKDVNGIVAFVIAFIGATTAWTVSAIEGFIPWVGFLALTVVVFLMLAAMFFGDVENLTQNKHIRWGGASIVAIVIIVVLYQVLDFGGGSIPITEQDIGFIILIIFGLAALYWITRDTE